MSSSPLKSPAARNWNAAPPRAIAPPNRYLDLYQCAVLGIAIAAIYTNLPIYGFMQNPAFPPKYFFFLIFFCIAPLILVRPAAFAAYLLSPFVLWSATLIVLNLIHLLNWSGEYGVGGVQLVDNQAEARSGLILTRIQYIAFAMFFGFLVFITSSKAYLHVAVALMVLMPCAVLLDFAQPGIFYPLGTSGTVSGRAAATFINPTMAGEVLLQVFVIGCAAIGILYRGPLFLLVGAGVLVTFSRSSIIAWLFLLSIFTLRKTLSRFQVMLILIAVGVFFLFIGNFENYLQSRDELEYGSSNILARLDFFSSFKFDDDSSEERADVGRAAVELFLQNPIFGAGAGKTLFWSLRGSTHNQLLLLAAEYGLPGVGLWAWMVAILWQGRFFKDRNLQFAVVFLYAFTSMFTHQMIDGDSYWLTTFALASMRGGWFDAKETRQWMAARPNIPSGKL